MAVWTLGRLAGATGGPALHFSAPAGRELGLEPGREVTVGVGGREVRAALVQRPGRDPRGLWANPALLRALRLPAGLRLGVRTTAEPPGVRLGPVVGIFTTRGRHSLFGGQTPIIREMTRLAATQGVLAFAFTPGAVNWDSGTVRGYAFPAGRGRWRPGEFPFPDAVYNRVPGRRAECRPQVAAAARRLEQALGSRYFNPSFLDKWQTYQALMEEPRIRPLLPETCRYLGVPSVLELLDRYRVVFLKPTGGSQGRGIIRVLRRWPGHYLWQYQGPRSVRTGEAVGTAGLGRALARLIRGRKYLVQEGLELARVGGRPFDVRILMQRDESGRWRRTKVFARVGSYGGITSNISTGGTGEPLGKVVPIALARARPARRREIAGRIRETSNWLTPLVESALGVTLGELGLDLGVDRTGRVWLIEVNSRPWRNVTTERGSMALVRLALVRPLAYARHLAGFTREPAGVAAETGEGEVAP